MTVNLTVTGGFLQGMVFRLDKPGVYLLGRASDCCPRLPNNLFHQDISRHHCMLVVDPPRVWVQDLGSLNGTHVNHQELGKRRTRAESASPTDVRVPSRHHPLQDGDELALAANVVFRLGINLTGKEPDSSPQA